MRKSLVCINCPMGCSITVEIEDSKIISVIGNACPQGREYAEQECLRPMRILTTTVKIAHGTHRVLPVVSEKAIPLDLTFKAMEQARQVCVEAPVQAGDVMIENLAGTGVRLMASRSMKRI